MDPVGPWYASYNRLAAASVQPGTQGDFHHHLASAASAASAASNTGHGAAGVGVHVPSTSAGQLLLQAAHSTALAAGQLGAQAASAFNPGFLSPPTVGVGVGYDTMFSPLFTPKPGHYTPTPAQHRAQQALAQAQAHANKQGAESDLAALRENYAHHHQQGAFFDQGAAAVTGGSAVSASAQAALAWQGASPFGILPHETVVPSSPGAPAKAPTTPYDGFAAHFGSPSSQALNSVGGGKARSGSPQVSAPSKTSSSASGFFQSPGFGGPVSASQEYSETKSQLPQSQSGQQPQQQDYKRRTSGTGAAASQQQSGAAPEAPKTTDGKKLPAPTTGVGSGFMASYLKFLQGERDTSPPPATRGGRKAAWSRSGVSNSKTFNSNAQNDNKSAPESNGAMSSTSSVNSNAINSNSVPSGLNPSMIPKEDDRYFPIPKDRKRKFDGSEESYEDDDRRNSKPVLNVPATPLNNEKGGNNKKGRGNGSRAPAALQPMVPAAAGGTKKPRQMQSEPTVQQQYYYQQPNEGSDIWSQCKESDPMTASSLTPGVQRQRRAKKNTNLGYNEATEDDDALASFFDSDTDPPWTPQFKDEDEGDYDLIGRNKKVKRCRPSGSRNRSTSNILSAAAHSAGIDYADYSSEEESNVKKINQHLAIHHLGQQAIISRQPEEMPYQPGEFVVIKSELTEAWPSIWRVDGKALLQKYEPYEQNGKVLYKNISTYAAWNPENKKLYTQVPVRVRAQTVSETIVELLRSEIVLDDNDFIVKRMQETIVYQDNFEVYIQTLISHALDPNFLTEIFQEQDEYFLSNVKTVDDITEERRRRIIGSSWSRGLEVGLATWPCFSSTELGPAVAAIMCQACRIQRAQYRIQLYGQPYNPATLERCQPDPRFAYEKEQIVCRGCSQKAELYSRIAHQKYLMFLECNKRVEDKRTQDPHKDTTLILNELLADEPWLSQLFRDVRQSWAEAESMERKSRQGMTSVRQHM